MSPGSVLKNIQVLTSMLVRIPAGSGNKKYLVLDDKAQDKVCR